MKKRTYTVYSDVYHNHRYPRKGEIYYIEKGNSTSTGHETWSNRYAIIVSDNNTNKKDNVVQVVYITTEVKKKRPTHVDVSTTKKRRTAMCEQITTVDKSRIVSYKGYIRPERMLDIDRAVAYRLGLKIQMKNLDNSSQM